MSADRPSRATAALCLVQIVDVAGAGDRTRLEATLSAGVTSIWLRDPAATGRTLFEAASALRALTEAAGRELWIGDRLDVALAVEADGVQLGYRAVPAARVRPWYRGRVGVSCHDAVELRAAEAAGADHVVLSPVFPVPDKGPALGLDGLRALLGQARLPVVALGGITPECVASVRALGVAGVAVARALSNAPSVGMVARALGGVTRA